MNEKNIGMCSTISTCSTMGSFTQFTQMKCPQRNFNDLHEKKISFFNVEIKKESLVQESRYNTHM
jgi:hypothetical protein